ncbi:hypothetical protein QBZ16_005166 [Prototheca wickerhamii]|uniref:Uncharacterized protein n=1 Tax=Prototheca wickerhamii TaxID=3111 RepID=A0AAD9MKT3_PROWI|nr:hypothetical protein QBZ16_005166 [Prototheca wickerhamii]
MKGRVRNQKSRSEYEEKWQQTMTQASDYQKKWQRSPMEARGQSKLCVVAGSSIVCMDTLRRESLEGGEGQAKTPPRQRKEPKMRAGFATYRPPPALGSSPRLKLAEEKPPPEVRRRANISSDKRAARPAAGPKEPSPAAAEPGRTLPVPKRTDARLQGKAPAPPAERKQPAASVLDRLGKGEGKGHNAGGKAEAASGQPMTKAQRRRAQRERAAHNAEEGGRGQGGQGKEALPAQSGAPSGPKPAETRPAPEADEQGSRKDKPRRNRRGGRKHNAKRAKEHALDNEADASSVEDEPVEPASADQAGEGAGTPLNEPAGGSVDGAPPAAEEHAAAVAEEGPIDVPEAAASYEVAPAVATNPVTDQPMDQGPGPLSSTDGIIDSAELLGLKTPASEPAQEEGGQDAQNRGCVVM